MTKIKQYKWIRVSVKTKIPEHNKKDRLIQTKKNSTVRINLILIKKVIRQKWLEKIETDNNYDIRKINNSCWIKLKLEWLFIDWYLNNIVKCFIYL